MSEYKGKQKVTIEQLRKHVKTHSERSNDDRNAVTELDSFLRSDGKIFTQFEKEDKWPNVDGVFELVPDPNYGRQPKKRFVVQIKGTSVPKIAEDGKIHYQLKDLGFPAYVATEVSLDPGILFLVLNPGTRSQERVFWKYMSSSFIASIDFSKESAVIIFEPEEEIFNTDDSVNALVEKLDSIADNHSYMKQLEIRKYGKDDILKLVTARCNTISEMIEIGYVLDQTREIISKRVLTQLNDLCKGTMLLNALQFYKEVNLRTAWETALMDIDTKFLATFYQGLRYIDLRIPEEGQNERLMLKYYSFLWRIRKYLKETFSLTVLDKLELFPHNIAQEDKDFNQLLADAIITVQNDHNPVRQTRYYIQKKTAFYIDSERYFEITLQLADMYATKYNRLTVYSKKDISSNYSIQIGYTMADIILLDEPTKIMVITDWRVSIAPYILNKLSKMVKCNTKITSRHNEYRKLMDFLTQTGVNFLDFIDLSDERFNDTLARIYDNSKSSYSETLKVLHQLFNDKATTFGRNTIRYSLISLKEELLEDLLPSGRSAPLSCENAFLSSKCYTFERNPILYNLPRHKTNGKYLPRDIIRTISIKNSRQLLPYMRVRFLTETTGELFHLKEDIVNTYGERAIEDYNSILTPWDKKHGKELKEKDGYIYIDEYVNNTVYILKTLLRAVSSGNAGQEKLNNSYVSKFDTSGVDELKVTALKTVFVKTKVSMIYGAAGTGKTTLMNYYSDLMAGRKKLFLTKTHTALDNLRRRITSPGEGSVFMGIDRFINTRQATDYDIVFVDECSTIDNRTMVELLKKIDSNSLLVLAGDIYQIESIDFGNWFFYAKEILPKKAIVELTGTWRTQEQNIINLWEEVRFLLPLITEKLVIDGPFSMNIGKELFEKTDEDEVVLCLNYDGKFGLNCINNYFQDANHSSDVFYWGDWKYKIGDPVLFNESRRFPMLYNNLKGIIVNIENGNGNIYFTIDIPIVLTSLDVRGSELEILENGDNTTRVRFGVFENDEGTETDDSDEARLRSIVPFQLAYAVSIHKAQGLEYNSIKVVIPSSNTERISHGIFYTAITRTKEKLKIFWSADTMAKVIENFSNEVKDNLSVDMIKPYLQ